MRKRLILHVGQHKTGSTYLQKRIYDDRDRLASLGILYPVEFWSIFAHHALPAGLSWDLDQSVVDHLNRLIAADFASFPTVILSSENFCFLSPERLAIVRDAFAGWDISVIYYARRLSGFWPSHWQELVKHGHDNTFSEYMNATLQPTRSLRDYPDQIVQLGTFADVFGYDNLSVVAYDNAMDRGEDIYDLFLKHMLGVPAGAEASRQINASFKPARTEILRALNMRHMERGQHGKGSLVREKYMKNVKVFEDGDAFARFSEAFSNYTRTLSLSPDHVAIKAHERALVSSSGRGSSTGTVRRRCSRQAAKRP